MYICMSMQVSSLSEALLKKRIVAKKEMVCIEVEVLGHCYVEVKVL
jgi:hypothetical protein